MNKFLGYTCSICRKEYLPGQVTYTCPKDGGNLDVRLDYEAIRKKYQPEDITSRADPSIWRYLPLLPVSAPSGNATPLHQVGGTPVYALPALASRHDLGLLWLKDESRNPTGSLKDRASALVIGRAMDMAGADGRPPVIITASTGNAGAALAGMAAATGQKAVILVPRSAPQAKIAQLLIFGAKVILVDGNYDQAFDLSIKAADEFGWYCRNTGYNPFTAEGKKTAAFEIWEWWRTENRERRVESSQTNPYSLLTILCPVGDGNIISGLHKGFKDLLHLGWIEQMPRIVGVQAAGSAAIATAFQAGTEQITPVQANTIADSISVDLPRDGVRALRAARESGGTYVTVSDQEILEAMVELGSAGVFAEPAGAAAYAGLTAAKARGRRRERSAERWLEPDSRILVINTGSGLKDVRAAMQATTPAPVIEPTLEALKKQV